MGKMQRVPYDKYIRKAIKLDNKFQIDMQTRELLFFMANGLDEILDTLKNPIQEKGDKK